MADTSEAITDAGRKDPKEFMEFAQKSAGPIPAKFQHILKKFTKLILTF